MYKSYLLFALMIALTLSLFGSISPEILANMPTAQTEVVQLTSQGFSPAVITITVGMTVIWENKTSQNYTLQSGSPYAVYLPVMMANNSNKRAELYSTVIKPQEVFGGNFPPNGQLTHQFQGAGNQSYYITGHANFSGRVIVLPGTTGTTTPTASATSPNQATTSPTATRTTVPNTTATNTTVPNASATNTAVPNATVTNTAIPNATATNTPPPNATATNTAVPNATATNTTVPNATATNTAVSNATATNTTVPNATATNTAAPNATATNTPTPTSGATATATIQPLVSAWMMNTTNETAAYIKTSGASILVNITSTQSIVVNQQNYVLVKGSGIPNYTHTMTSAEVQTLNARPKASTDFVTGKTTVSAGQLVKFGQDMGFKSRNTCTAGAGYGYWPPGPECPTNQSKSKYFPLSQTVSSTTCKTGLNAIGLWVNGVSVYNWGDGTYYDTAKTWQNLAPVAEYYDIDMCLGHAANGDYHHHGYPFCLAEQLADTGKKHSPIYGFAADGYPIYGPWHADGSLAKSCWQKRDYSDTTKGGCGVANKRICKLTDQYDVTKGTTTVSSAGPDTTATFTSLSGNIISAASGAYYEDYYYDSTCTSQGGAYLDKHNGHTHDGLGYHYHVTVTQNNDGTLKDAFPFIVGPTFYGALQNGAITTCSTGGGGGPPPAPREQSHDDAGHEH